MTVERSYNCLANDGAIADDESWINYDYSMPLVGSCKQISFDSHRKEGVRQTAHRINVCHAERLDYSYKCPFVVCNIHPHAILNPCPPPYVFIIERHENGMIGCQPLPSTKTRLCTLGQSMSSKSSIHFTI